jgi:hypothetical protein
MPLGAPTSKEYQMRRIFQLSTLCFAAGVVSACKPEEVTSVTLPPMAGTRFINAVPDTGAAFGLDFRFVDFVENSDQFGIGFRNNPQSSGGVTASAQIQYKPAQAGSRHYRVFLDDTLQSVATKVLADSTATLEATHNYTFLLMGNARSTGSDKMRLTVIDETVPDPGSQVALRVINTTSAPIEVRQYPSSGTVPATATWANVPAYSISNYVTVAPAQIKFNVRAAGASTTLFADPLALIGQPVGTSTAGCTVGVDCDVVPGTTVPGSAVTLIVFPASVTGSLATKFAAPGVSFMWDRRPPRACTVSFGC